MSILGVLTFEDFLPQLERDLRVMPAKYRIAFSAACCERALGNLESYARDVNAIDASAVRQVLDETWAFIGCQRAVLDIVVLREACEAQLPPREDNHVLASAAADAVQMLGLLLQQVADPRAEISVEIAAWAQATIDGYLQIGPPRITDLESLAAADLMRRELSRQSADIEWLKQQPALDSPTIEVLRSRIAADGASLAGM